MTEHPGQAQIDSHIENAGVAAAGHEAADAHYESARGGSNDIERRPITSQAEWLSWRLTDFTASDTGALFGLHPWRTLLKIWAEKSGLTMGGIDSAVLRRGRWGEAAVLEMLADEHPNWEIRRAKVYLRDPELRLGATPDAAAIDPEREGVGTVECKTTTRSAFEKWPDGEPPLFYQLQTLTEMMLMGASWGVIAILVMDSWGGWHPQLFTVERHAVAEAKIRQAVTKFWRDFDVGLMPAVNIERDADVVAEIYAKPLTKTPLDLSNDNILPIELVERAGLKTTIKTAEKRVVEIDTDIKAKLGIHERAELPGWAISWKTEHTKEYIVKAHDRRVLRVSEKAPA